MIDGGLSEKRLALITIWVRDDFCMKTVIRHWEL